MAKAVPLLMGRYLAPPHKEVAFVDRQFDGRSFADHYEKYLRPRLDEFENKRMATLRGYARRLIVFFPVSLALLAISGFVLPFLIARTNDWPGYLIVPVLNILLIWVWATVPLRRYSSGVKSEIYPLIFNFFGDDFQYAEA
ncbi:MAG: hypothetical protein O7A03_06485, partial [Alphaproteobacteria bacterium]|nr:hypothetical protein [Alphaproteobacteria bacterium]